MSETTSPISGKPAQRVFLVVVDESDEMKNALRFACRRALNTAGRVALLYVIEPAEFQHWLGVGRILEADARSAAEQRMQALSADVYTQTGSMPAVHIREGRRGEELVALIGEDPSISLLVLATAAGGNSPGPLVTHLLGSLGGKVRIPVTLVPGELSEAEIDQVT